MIDKGRKFEADIKKLKELSAKRKRDRKKFEAVYLQFRNELAKKYGKTVRTVQNWLKDKTPWIRNQRDDAGKERVTLPADIKLIIKDAIDSGKTKKQAMELVIIETGNKVSDRKANQVLAGEVNPNEPAYFGTEFKEFLNTYFQLDLIPSAKGIKLKFGKVSYPLHKHDHNDILMILTNAYNRAQFATENKIKFDRSYLRKVRTWHLLEQLLTLATERNDMKIFNVITQSMKRLEVDPAKFANPNFLTLEKICKDLQPDITFDEIYHLLEKHTKQD